jgi:DNA-binding FadR family transcriptional regulator
VATDQIRQRILGGDLNAGDRLPPERQLAETLGINRQTLRAALVRLQTEGLVMPRQGSGVTVQEWRRTGGIGLLPHLVRAGRFDLLEPFLAVRRAVAAEALATACSVATDREIRDLDALAQQLSVESDLETLADGNLEFARQILRIARNLPAELLFNTVAELYNGSPRLRGLMLADPDSVRASFPAIVALMRARQPEVARQVVNQVLSAIDASTLSKTGEPA